MSGAIRPLHSEFSKDNRKRISDDLIKGKLSDQHFYDGSKNNLLLKSDSGCIKSIYVDGHGRKGSETIKFGIDGQDLNYKEVADRLIESGLSKEYDGDIKLYSCFSSEPVPKKLSFADLFTLYMRDQGFTNCNIFGYEGSIDAYPVKDKSEDRLSKEHDTQYHKYSGDTGILGENGSPNPRASKMRSKIDSSHLISNHIKSHLLFLESQTSSKGLSGLRFGIMNDVPKELEDTLQKCLKSTKIESNPFSSMSQNEIGELEECYFKFKNLDSDSNNKNAKKLNDRTVMFFENFFNEYNELSTSQEKREQILIKTERKFRLNRLSVLDEVKEISESQEIAVDTGVNKNTDLIEKLGELRKEHLDILKAQGFKIGLKLLSQQEKIEREKGLTNTIDFVVDKKSNSKVEKRVGSFSDIIDTAEKIDINKSGRRKFVVDIPYEGEWTLRTSGNKRLLNASRRHADERLAVVHLLKLAESELQNPESTLSKKVNTHKYLAQQLTKTLADKKVHIKDLTNIDWNN